MAGCESNGKRCCHLIALQMKLSDDDESSRNENEKRSQALLEKNSKIIWVGSTENQNNWEWKITHHMQMNLLRWWWWIHQKWNGQQAASRNLSLRCKFEKLDWLHILKTKITENEKLKAYLSWKLKHCWVDEAAAAPQRWQAKYSCCCHFVICSCGSWIWRVVKRLGMWPRTLQKQNKMKLQTTTTWKRL